MDQKRPLTEKEHLSDFSDDKDVEPFSSGSSDNYEPEIKEDSESELKNDLSFQNFSVSSDNEVSDVKENQTNESPANLTDTREVNDILEWFLTSHSFASAKNLPIQKKNKINEAINLHSNPM